MFCSVRKKKTDDMQRGDIVELRTNAEMSEPFRGRVIEMRSRDTVLSPVSSPVEPKLLGINVRHDKSRFKTLLKSDGRRINDIYSIDDMIVYDPDTVISKDLNAEEITTVQNIVGSGSIDESLTYEEVKEAIIEEGYPEDHVRREEDPTESLHFYPDGDNDPQLTLHDSGKYIVRASSESELYTINDIFLEILCEDDPLTKERSVVDSELEVSNLVGLANLECEIELDVLSESLCDINGSESVEYEPQVFPAVEYGREDTSSQFLIYPNGKIIVAGAGSVEELMDNIQTAYDDIYESYFCDDVVEDY